MQRRCLLRMGQLHRTDVPVRLHRPPTNVISYFNAHTLVKRRYGPASAQECIGCGGTARQWALMADEHVQHDERGRAFSMTAEDYGTLCYGCHRDFDRAWDADGLDAAWLDLLGDFDAEPLFELQGCAS